MDKRIRFAPLEAIQNRGRKVPAPTRPTRCLHPSSRSRSVYPTIPRKWKPTAWRIES